MIVGSTRASFINARRSVRAAVVAERRPGVASDSRVNNDQSFRRNSHSHSDCLANHHQRQCLLSQTPPATVPAKWVMIRSKTQSMSEFSTIQHIHCYSSHIFISRPHLISSAQPPVIYANFKWHIFVKARMNCDNVIRWPSVDAAETPQRHITRHNYRST